MHLLLHEKKFAHFSKTVHIPPKSKWLRLHRGPVWANFGPHLAHMFHCGPFWVEKGPLLTLHLLTYHLAAPDISSNCAGFAS